MEDRYPPIANTGQSTAPVNPHLQPNNAGAAYQQNSPHSVGAARAAKKAAMPETQSGASPFYSGAINWMTTPNTGASQQGMNNANAGSMPSMQDNPNTGTMPYMQSKPNTGAMPYTQNMPNTGAMPYAQNMPNTGAMPYAQNMPNTGAMPYMQEKPGTGALPYSAGQKKEAGLESEMTECSYKMGTPPPCAPLSAGYVPFQQPNPPKYSNNDALTRGTLFPGLDLPYLNIVNKDHPYAGTPLGELMALRFVITELNLYLDTHPKDNDALMMHQSMNKLLAEGQERFVRLYGPISITDITSGDEYMWLDNPWPWDFNERSVRD